MNRLRERVLESYGQMNLPSWPDPHPGMSAPADEEYSRVTDPGRYRIVHERARAWAASLGLVPGVEKQVLDLTTQGADGPGWHFERGLRLASGRPGTLPLLLLESDARPGAVGSTAGLRISVVRPELELLTVPGCGCDACDDGSDFLLREIDDTIGQVVGGPFVMLRGKGWQAQWHPSGGSYSQSGHNHPPYDRVVDWGRQLASGESPRLPAETETYVGCSWLE